MAKTKQIKVQYSSRCTYGGYYGSSRYTNYPKIQMEGKWLEALGFHIGDQLMVEYEEGSIKISLVPKPEPVLSLPPNMAGLAVRTAKKTPSENRRIFLKEPPPFRCGLPYADVSVSV